MSVRAGVERFAAVDEDAGRRFPVVCRSKTTYRPPPASVPN
jgi:hypothetical protein